MVNTKKNPSKFQKDLGFQYSWQRRPELLIAIGRLVLATFSLLAIWLDPSEPSRYEDVAYALLWGYVAYSLLLTVVILRLHRSPGNLLLFTHAFDLLLFTLFMFFTEGATSPFFVYFVFSVSCATLRWGWRGALWTATIALVMFTGMGIYAGEIMQDPAFELNRFIIRSAYLAVVASLLGYLGAYEERLRRELLSLAAWPRTVHKEVQELVREMLEYGAGILRARRMLLAWEEEEPWIYFASWSRKDFRHTREPPDLYEPLVAEPLNSINFLCLDAHIPVPTVIHTSPAGLKQWRGEPLNRAFRDQFDVRAVLSLSMEGKGLRGRLFVLDKKGMSTDDLVLGRIVAQEMVTQMDYFYVLRQLQQSAATEERVRMARDLHDGLLQSLTGAALQLETVRHLIETDPHTVKQQLLEIQHLIAAEQKDLRVQIQDLKTSSLSSPEVNPNLAARLEELAERIKRQWGIRAELKVKDLPRGIPRPLIHGIYFMVHESLINAARHAKASSVRAQIDVEDNRVNITVSDDGHGFPFQGRYDHTTLTALNLGPLTLRERAIALGGSLNIESTSAGTRLEITLPFTPAGD